MKHLRRVLLPLLTVALLVSSLPSFSQTPASQTSFAQTPEPRIKGAITGSSRAVLANSRTPRVRDAEDRGAVASNTPIPGITLVFKRSPTQEANLQELLAAQQNTASPLYHQWLTPETFATRFGVAAEDIAATQSWLTSRGFHIDSVSRSRDRITFSGTAAQVQAAFSTELHHYRTTEGEQHFAPAADLTLPAELVPVTAAVLHLSDFRPKPNVKIRPHPDYTAAPTQIHYLGPQDITVMYDLNPLYQISSGTGQGLAVVGQSYVNLSEGVSYFRGNLAPGTVNISTVLVPNSGVEATSPGDEGESEIDLEYSSGIATNANIFLVYVGSNQNFDVFDALSFAITENIAPVVSISYGICEQLLSASELSQNNALFEEAASQGQTLVASSGDSGSTACASFPSSEATTAQQQALAVSFPASSPYVTAVGGTQMAPGTFTSGANSYWDGATSSDVISSLLSYVPEVAWNEDSASNGIAAGGGGASTVFPRPTWQSAFPGIPAGSFRLLPDIALQSSIDNPGFLFCTTDPSLADLQGLTNSCANGLLGSNNKYTVAGGTSFAAPIFAGYIALLNGAKNATGQGNVNTMLYTLASTPTTYATAFHDITSGTNACLPVAAVCSTPGQSNYAAATGYDQATGLGSIDFNALTKVWPASSAANLLPTVVNLTVSPTAAAVAEPVSIQIGIGPLYAQTAINVPTGSVSVSVDGVVAQASLALSANSTATYSLIAPSTPGYHLIVVTYSGDATHSTSTSTYSLLAGSVTATGSFSVSAANLTVANGSQGSIPISATPAAGYSGRVAWSLAASTTNGTAEVCYTIRPSTTSNLNAATLTIFVGSACNSPSPAVRSNLRPIHPGVAAKREAPYPWRKTQIALYAGLILCGFLARHRRKIPLSLLLALASLTCIATTLTGCGGGSGGNNPGTPPAVSSNATTYTLTLTGKDSVNTSITASTTFTLTVN
ncbi:S53 family peptidase [Tunturiibacter empetritectus]|uniref:Subtilase family serine protease n=2 Tax=Tunturiibacter TaxID=3154218 RepID=A0A852VEK3_9BACT|nr:S53 family peptidase [Edaphobacter lichenicola]NYF89359.1 subtilase family serine protease [Edaphobacter lichenicola]